MRTLSVTSPFRASAVATLGLGALLALSACATSPHAVGDAGTTDEAALLLATDTYELHYREGRVVVLDARPDREVRPRDVATYAEFRELYEVRAADRVPERQPTEGVEVSGWRGLDCVRDGHACGRQSEWPVRDLIRLRLRFPEPR